MGSIRIPEKNNRYDRLPLENAGKGKDKVLWDNESAIRGVLWKLAEFRENYSELWLIFEHD